MGFLKKIFKKKKKTAVDSVAPVRNGKTNDGKVNRVPPSNTASNSSSEKKEEQEPGRIVISPRSSNSENYDHSNAVSPRLNQQHLQQLERQQAYGNQSPIVHQPIFQMSADLPRQQMYAMDEMNRSDASSSSFNLSTDAEDSEYENLRNRGVLPGTITNPSALDMSMSGVSIPTSYATDQETIFAALDDLTMPSMTTATTKDHRSSALDPARSQQEEMARKLGLMPPPPPRPPTPEDEPGYIPSPTKKPSEEWAISPSTAASNDPGSIKGVDSDPSSWAISPSSNEPESTKSAKSNHFFHFDEDPTMIDQMNSTPTRTYSSGTSPPATTVNRNTPGDAKRNFTSPRSQASSSTGFSNGFENDFADFGNFKGWGDET